MEDPEIKTKRNVSVEKWKEYLYKSNLLLQILLFSNVYISILWTIFCGYYLIHNIVSFGKIHTIFSTFGFLLGVPAEAFRLYLGYSGNLRGMLSDLSGFLILSAVIQLPIQVYFTYTNESGLILRILQYLMLTWLIFEIPIGSYASRKLSIYHAQLYHIKLLAKTTSHAKY